MIKSSSLFLTSGISSHPLACYGIFIFFFLPLIFSYIANILKICLLLIFQFSAYFVAVLSIDILNGQFVTVFCDFLLAVFL